MTGTFLLVSIGSWAIGSSGATAHMVLLPVPPSTIVPGCDTCACDLDGAIAAYARAVEIEDTNSYTEPPDWSQSMRLYLGAAQLDAGQAAEAEATFRQDLEWKQQSGWSTFGLYQAIEAQGRSAEALIVKRQFESFWRNADVTLSRAHL